MSVIPLKKDGEEWLNPDIVEPERLLPLLKQYPGREMEAYPMSTTVKRGHHVVYRGYHSANI
jgi:putative SOS response-associated peptidase YedK